MKNLDLKKFGVQELDSKEMVEVDGGFWQFVAGYVGGKLIDAYLADPASAGDKDPTSLRGAYR